MYDSERFGFVEMIGRHTHTHIYTHTHTHTRWRILMSDSAWQYDGCLSETPWCRVGWCGRGGGMSVGKTVVALARVLSQLHTAGAPH